jgi:hypothetical protein
VSLHWKYPKIFNFLFIVTKFIKPNKKKSRDITRKVLAWKQELNGEKKRKIIFDNFFDDDENWKRGESEHLRKFISQFQFCFILILSFKTFFEMLSANDLCNMRTSVSFKKLFFRYILNKIKCEEASVRGKIHNF